MNKPICTHISVNDIQSDGLVKWLEKNAEEHKLKYLLAHAEDGVIWGYFKEGELVASGNVFPQLAKLRLCTLQQCRIFGKVMLWKVGESWKARLIKDEHLSKEDYICEKQILWGTQQEGEFKPDFTLVSDGSQGLKHAVPLTNIPFSQNKNNLYRPIRLIVHHYIDYDDNSGVARICLSRLVDLRGAKI